MFETEGCDLLGGFDADILQLPDAQHVEHEIFVERVGLALPHLEQEVFLKPDLGGMDPFAA